MLRRLSSYKQILGEGNDLRARALCAFMDFFERRTGSEILCREPPVSPELYDLIIVAQRMKKNKVIGNFFSAKCAADEPRQYVWLASVFDALQSSVYTMASGSSFHSELSALAATLAEATERFVWRFETDYFNNSQQILFDKGLLLGGQNAVGNLTDSERATRIKTFFSVEGYNWTRVSSQHIPAQFVSGKNFELTRGQATEPWLREKITSGLATWTTREGAVCRGLLELLERDAYMNMWLNQISLSRYDAAEISMMSGSLAQLITQCQRYRLQPHFIRLITDAPTHAVCVALVDETDNKPRMILGLKANSSLALASEGALLEALRIRNAVRNDLKKGKKAAVPLKDIGYTDRLLYWTEEKNISKLDFLISGPVIPIKLMEWENDKDEAHLQRLVEWCRKKDYECTSVSLTKAKANVTPWHIEMVVVPQLQWMHLHEKYAQVNEVRRIEVPKLFGYKPRSEAFLSEPHPFA